MKKPSIKRVAYQYLKKQAGEVHIEHEGGDPSPKHKKLKEKIDKKLKQKKKKECQCMKRPKGKRECRKGIII